jgi:hypothetical protein
MTITLTYLRNILDYNPATGIFRWKYRPGRRTKAGAIVGSVDGGGYVTIKIDGKTYKAHRLAWLHITGEWPENDIDHIDTVRTNNRARNLRDATSLQNQANKSVQRNNRLGVKGVALLPSGRFGAVIKVNGQQRRLGVFDTMEEASAAYGQAANDAYGEYARISLLA